VRSCAFSSRSTESAYRRTNNVWRKYGHRTANTKRRAREWRRRTDEALLRLLRACLHRRQPGPRIVTTLATFSRHNLITPHGATITAQFFDIGQSRSLPWQRRPEATRLLTALRDPQRGFTAVVIGEPHRAFYGNQFGLTMPLFTHYGVRLWVPEVGGPINPDNEAHDLVMSVFGGMSKGERNRIKVRVRTAMATRPRSKVATWAAARRTATPWPTSARTPTPPKPPTDAACTA
jgi:hypothetical protein